MAATSLLVDHVLACANSENPSIQALVKIARTAPALLAEHVLACAGSENPSIQALVKLA